MVSPVPTPSGGTHASSGFRHAVVAQPRSAKPAGAATQAPAPAPAPSDAAMPSPDTVKALFAYYRSVGAIPSDPLPAVVGEDGAASRADDATAPPVRPDDAVSSSGPAKLSSAAHIASGVLDIGNGRAETEMDPTASGSTGLYVPRPDQDPKFLYLDWDAHLKLTQASRFYSEVLKAADMFPTGTQPGETS